MPLPLLQVFCLAALIHGGQKDDDRKDHQLLKYCVLVQGVGRVPLTLVLSAGCL